MKALGVLLVLASCKEPAPPPVKTEPVAAPAPAIDAAPKREVVIELRSMHIDKGTRTFVYATEPGWRSVDGKVEPFQVDAATAEDWKALHGVLKAKTDAFVGESKKGKFPIEHIGIYLYPTGAAPDLKKSKGDPGITTIAFYGNLLIVGTWRFCFGGHLGTGPNMRKCIDDSEPASATTYVLQ